MRELIDIAESPAGLTVTVDLQECALRAAGRSWTFPADGRSRRLLLEGLDVIDATLRRAAAVEEYERTRRARWLPSIPRGAFDSSAQPSGAGAGSPSPALLQVAPARTTTEATS